MLLPAVIHIRYTGIGTIWGPVPQPEIGPVRSCRNERHRPTINTENWEPLRYQALLARRQHVIRAEHKVVVY
jgi:hypothetical protein